MVKIVNVNQATLGLYDAKSVEEMLGELGRVLTHESQAEIRFREELVALGEGKTRFASEFDNQTLTGAIKHVSLILSVVPGYEATLGKVLVSIIDRTDLKAMEERLHQAERLAAIGETAAMVGHDLRNPLQGITTATYLLRNDSLTIEDRNKMLQLIDDGVNYSNKIVSDLLDYSREVHPTLAVVALRELTRSALQTVKVPDTIEVRDQIQEQTSITADQDMMRRVFVNLIANAVDSMPDGRDLTISSIQSGEEVEITVSDTGTGLGKEVLANPWKPLQTTKAKGMGLGLPICKRIVDAHGGEISVESKTGEGTKFTIRLPIKGKP